jgi:hypothetical protein
MKYIILLIIFDFILGIIIPNEITIYIFNNFLDKEYINFTKLFSNFECIESFLNNSNSLSKTFSYSGKYLGDFGNEEECLYNNKEYEYFLLYFDVDITKFVNTTQFKQLYFKNITNYFIGICNLKKCEKLMNELFTDKNFKDFLENESGIKNGTINNITSSDNYEIDYPIYLRFCFIFFICYISFCLTITFFFNK